MLKKERHPEKTYRGGMRGKVAGIHPALLNPKARLLSLLSVALCRVVLGGRAGEPAKKGVCVWLSFSC